MRVFLQRVFLQRVFLLCAFLLPVPAFAQAPAEVNLSLMAQKAIPTVSDSIDGSYSYLAGAFADDKTETAWVTGRDMREHWAHLEWRNTAVSINRVEIDCTPLTFIYNPQKMFGEVETPPAVNLTTVKPKSLELQAYVTSGWKTIQAAGSAIEWQGDKAIFTPAQPLTGVTQLRLRLQSSGPDELFAVRELRVMGPAAESSFSMRPKWPGVWLWGELEPNMANYGLVRRFFRHVFEIPDLSTVRAARLLFVAHDRGQAWINGQPVARTAHTGTGMNREIARKEIPLSLLKQGKNLLALEGEDVAEVGLRGVTAELCLEKKDGSTESIATQAVTFQASSDDAPGWNSSLTGFGDWPRANALSSPNAEIAWGWSVDYTPAFFSGSIRVTNVDLKPPVPRPGDAFTLTVGVQADQPLNDAYGLIVDYGDIGPIRVSYMDFSRGEGFVRPENGLPKGFQGERQLTISGVWTAGATPRLPLFLRFVNPKRQLQILPGKVGEVTAGEQPGRLKVYVGTPSVRYTKTGFPDVKLPQGGRLTIDGQPVAPIVYTSSLQTPERYTKYLKSGIKLYRILPGGASEIVPDDGDEEGHYARLLKAIELQIEAIHSIEPDAKFLLYIELDMPNDWKFQHPEDIIVMGDGGRINPLDASNHSIGYIQETPNAKAVLRKVRESLTAFITRLEKQPYAHSIVGLAMGHGRAGENYWGLDANMSQDDNGDWIIPDRQTYFWGDYGNAARRNFRDWLKARYGTKEKLAQAWKIENIDFEDVASSFKWPIKRFVTDLMWRKRPAGRFMFRDRTAEGSLFHDYAEYLNEARAELFVEAGKAIKAASGGRLLTGGYIGYVVPALTNSPPASAQHSGHLAMRTLMSSPYIDIMFSPDYYHMRRQGDPVMPMGLTDSLRVNGKLWMNEYDSRSFLSPISPKTFSQRETLEVFQKEFGNAITRDQGWWWYEFNFNTVGKDAASWFADEAMIRDANTMKRVYDNYLKLPASGPSAEIAVFVNAEQPYYTDVYSPANTVHSDIANYLIPRLSMLGAPFDLYAQSDLAKLKERGWLKNYKLVLFVNAFHLDATDRAIIDTDLKKDGRTLLFFFAPGYQGNPDPKTELALGGIEAATGLQGVRKLDEEHLIGLTLNDTPLMQGIKEREFDAIAWWGKEQIDNYGNPIGPVFYLDATAANGWQPLASLRIDKKVDSAKTALALLKQPNYTSIYSVIPDLPAEVLSAIAAQSGVHIYSKPGILTWANERFLCVHTGRAARQLTLRAKEPVTWIEPFEKKSYGRKSATITIDLEPGETKFFCLEKNGEWQDLLK